MFKLLIIILTIFSTTFPMSKNEQNIINYYEHGMSLKSEGNVKDAARWFAMAAKIDLPDPGTGPLGDLYETARNTKKDAVKEIANIASQFEKDQKYDEALKIYQELPDTFSAQIKKIESIKKDSEQLAQAKTLITQNKYDEALQILVTLKSPEISNEVSQLETQIKASQQKAADEARQEQERLAQEALQQKLAEVRRLINAERYDEASTILNTLPATNEEVINLKEEIANGKEIKRAEELAEKNNNYQEAYKILEQIKDKGSTKANLLDQKLIKEQLANANALASRGDYAGAYAILDILKANRPGEEVQKTETDINRKKQQAEEAQKQKQEEEQRKASEAEKKRIAQEEIERKKQLAQEAQRRIQEEEQRKVEEAEKQRLAQEEAERKKQEAQETKEQEQLTKALQFITAENYEEARKILSTLDLNQPLSSPEASQRRDELRELIRAYQYAYGLDKNYTAAYSILDSLRKGKLSPEIGDEITKLETKINTKKQEQTIPDKPLTKDLNNAFNYLANTLTLITKYIVESPTGSKTTHLLEAPTRFRPRPPGRAASTKPLSQQK